MHFCAKIPLTIRPSLRPFARHCMSIFVGFPVPTRFPTASFPLYPFVFGISFFPAVTRFPTAFFRQCPMSFGVSFFPACTRFPTASFPLYPIVWGLVFFSVRSLFTLRRYSAELFVLPFRPLTRHLMSVGRVPGTYAVPNRVFPPMSKVLWGLVFFRLLRGSPTAFSRLCPITLNIRVFAVWRCKITNKKNAPQIRDALTKENENERKRTKIFKPKQRKRTKKNEGTICYVLIEMRVHQTTIRNVHLRV